MPLPLPQELVDEIIDQLHASDPDSKEFHSVALVCRAFRHQAQRNSFRNPSFHFKKNDGSWPAKLQNRRRVLDRNPNIAHYVRDLYFPIVQDTLWLFDHPEFIRMMEIVAMASADRMEDRLQVQLVGTRNKHEHGHETTARSRIPERFMQHVFDSIGPYVEVLTISNINNMPCRWIADCTNLFKLVISNISLSKTDSWPTGSQLSQPRVLSLSWLDDYVADIDYMVDFAFNPGHLRIFESQFNDQDCLDGVVSIVDACNNSLECLRLFCNEGGLRIADLYDLSAIPNLKYLFLKIDFSIEDDDDALEDLCTFLNTMSSGNNKFEGIVIEIMSDSHPNVAPLPHLAMANWNILDSTLIKLSGGKQLDVKILFFYEQESDVSRSVTMEDLKLELEDWIAERLPEASKESNISLYSEIRLID